MIKILFVCHGSILKCSGKACKINDSTIWQGVYCTTTTPFLKEPWNDNPYVKYHFNKGIVKWLKLSYDTDWVDAVSAQFDFKVTTIKTERLKL